MPEKNVKRPLIAALLSLICPGLGQLYTGQARKAAAILAFIPVYVAAVGATRLLATFGGFVFHLLAQLAIYLWVLVDAVRAARRSPEAVKWSRTRKLWSALAIVLLAMNLVGVITNFYIDHLIGGFRAYRVVSNSMATTILRGDRIMADRHYYERHNPQREDLVLIQTSAGLLPKRVVAIAGDAIAIEQQNVTLNGRQLAEPYAHYDPAADASDARFHAKLAPLTVPSGEIFVMGDNRSFSFDSRHFGSVPMDRVKGRPIYFYWSSDRTRIGKKIE